MLVDTEQNQNFLRLWEAKHRRNWIFKPSTKGVEAVREKATSESISKVLYPNDETESEKNPGWFSNISSLHVPFEI